MCKVLNVGSQNNKFETELENYFRVLVSYDIKIEQQCDKAARKAMRVLGMIKRSFKNLDEESLKTLYCAYVRLRLEFCIQAWSTYLKKDINEQVREYPKKSYETCTEIEETLVRRKVEETHALSIGTGTASWRSHRDLQDSDGKRKCQL